MLQTLRKHDPKEAQRILSNLTAELMPDPEVGRRGNDFGIDPQLHSKIWDEIRRRARVDLSDNSREMAGKVFEFLFSEMSQIALPQSGIDSVKAKLGARGELRSDLYEVRFSPIFVVSEAHGVRPNHVLEAIRNADDVQHLSLLDGEQLISMFVRVHNDLPGEDRFVLFVLAKRIGAHLDVSYALRLYLSDMDLSGANRPLDVLRCTVEKYGFLITVGHNTDKLILDKTITVKGRLEPDRILKIHALDGTKIVGAVFVNKRMLLDSYGIAVAFALDQAKYAADLRKHGVHVVDRDGDYRTSVLLSR